VQHYVFPWISTHCHGQYCEAIIHTLGLSSPLSTFDASFGAAIEGTMVNQLVVVPFFYYPVFFAVTALVQGLNMSEGYQRAQSMWVPLLQRNLAFWIPVQFIQFRCVEESLQIPFVCVAGLCWTIILSTVAGNSQLNQQQVPIAEADSSQSDPFLGALQEIEIGDRVDRNGTAAVLSL
jgi:Mpv17 / PMP22 family